MSNFHHDSDDPNLFWMNNPAYQPQRSYVDVSLLQGGPLEGLVRPFSSTNENEENLPPRALFPDVEDRRSSEQESSTAEGNDVTAASSEVLPARTDDGNMELASTTVPVVRDMSAASSTDDVAAILDAAVQRTKRRRIRLSYAVNKKVGSILVITISFVNNKVGGILVITISFALLESYHGFR